MTMDANTLHTPVMLDRVVELLNPVLTREGAVVLDATLGLGGHAFSLLREFPGITLVGVDRDGEALQLARRRLAEFGSRFRGVHAVYDRIDLAIAQSPSGRFDAVLFDLGVSSMQLDLVERGFSYSRDCALDMRMDREARLTAAAVLAEYSEVELRRIFQQYGEEKLAGRYAREIVQERQVSSITTSAQLVQLLDRATPAALRRTGHPAKRVFQALRIEVNSELTALQSAIPQALDALAPGGRMIVLSYQSLEDRFVKREFASRCASTAPRGLPVELPEHRPQFQHLVRGAELADEKQRQLNPRSIPVRLRAVQRIGGDS